MPKVLIAVGGTGGHLFPAKQLKEELSDYEILFGGSGLKTSPFFQGKDSECYQEIPSHPLQLSCVFPICRGIYQAFQWIRHFKPQVVVGFGSYHTFPILCAASLLNIPIVLFEANCSLGQVNRLFASKASLVAGQFPIERVNTTLVPLLPWTLSPKRVSPEQAREYFGLKPKCTTVLVFGGSQGAVFLNQEVPKALSLLTDIQVLHITGHGKTATYMQNAKVIPFEHQMALAYQAADFAICRAGASTIAELIQFQLPALLIPFPYAKKNHQQINAEYFEKVVQGGRCLLQSEMTLELLYRAIQHMQNSLPSMRLGLKEYLFHNQGRKRLSEYIRGVL